MANCLGLFIEHRFDMSYFWREIQTIFFDLKIKIRFWKSDKKLYMAFNFRYRLEKKMLANSLQKENYVVENIAWSCIEWCHSTHNDISLVNEDGEVYTYIAFSCVVCMCEMNSNFKRCTTIQNVNHIAYISGECAYAYTPILKRTFQLKIW